MNYYIVIQPTRILRNVKSNSFFVRGLATQPPLDLEFPGTPKLVPAKQQMKPEVNITTLPNGLRVISENRPGCITSFGMFVDVGSRYENYENNGVSHLLEHMAYKSSTKRSTLRFCRDIEDLGGHFGANTTREFSFYQGECMRDTVENGIEIIADTILNPKFTPWDIEEQKKTIGYELQDMEMSAQALLTEIIHGAAFSEQTSLGMPLWCPKRNLDKLNESHLRDHVDTHFISSRMILSAVGIEHDKIVSFADKYFSDLPQKPRNGKKAIEKITEYVGGERRLVAESPLTHIALCFNADGLRSPDIAQICVMHMLLGGGGSFSAGGPGKGMYSRLYTNVLNRNYWVDSATVFDTMYNDAGLFGIYGTCLPKDAGNLVDVISTELENIAKSTPNMEETNRAKNGLKSTILMKVESRQAVFEDLGRQLLSYNKYEPVSKMVEDIDSVTPESIMKVAQKMLSSKLTMASFGDLSMVPVYDSIAKRFN